MTKSEALAIIKSTLNVHYPDGYDIEISDDVEHAWTKILRSVLKAYPMHATREKIAAIRALRDGVGKTEPDPIDGRTFFLVGLADAKWAIENPSPAIHNLNRIGKIRPDLLVTDH